MAFELSYLFEVANRLNHKLRRYFDYLNVHFNTSNLNYFYHGRIFCYRRSLYSTSAAGLD